LYIKKAQVIPPGLIGGRMGGYTQREREREIERKSLIAFENLPSPFPKL